jgi:hypothetical protein
MFSCDGVGWDRRVDGSDRIGLHIDAARGHVGAASILATGFAPG